MKKPRIKRPKISSKPPGASPPAAHLVPMPRKRKSVPKSAHDPSSNLGKYLHKAKMPSGKTIGVKGTKSGAVKRVAKSITKTTKGLSYE